MQKLITITGRLNEKGSLANTLNVMAAKDGKNLTNYILEILKSHVDRHGSCMNSSRN